MVQRRNRHAYHDLGTLNQPDNAAQLATPTPTWAPPVSGSPEPIELPEMVQINQRLASFHMSSGKASKFLVDQIPGAQMPSTLSIGGNSREPIPEIPGERELSQAASTEGNQALFRTFQNACPPPADCQYTVVDQGVSGPDVFRASMYNVPVTSKLRESSQLPLALYLRPFANPDVPLADFTHFDGSEMPPRCHRCRAYMNPSMRFVQGGDRFVCNLCSFVNQTPPEYYQPLTQEGRRIDWNERPELAYGTYDFEVVRAKNTSGLGGGESELPDGETSGLGDDDTPTDSANIRPPAAESNIYGTPMNPLRRVFCCECSRDFVQKEVLTLFTAAVRESLQYLDSREEVAIMVFDDEVTYFRQLGSTDQFQMLVVPPGKNSPVPPNVFYNLQTSSTALNALLDAMPELYSDTTKRASCLGTAIDTAIDSVGEGGRVSVFFGSLPSSGPSALIPRDLSISGITDAQASVRHQLFLQTSKYYSHLSSRAVERCAAIDLFAIPITGYLDLASLSMLPQRTGGRLHRYPRFNFARDSRRVMADFAEIALPLQARAASVRFRCSNGLQVRIIDEYASTATDKGVTTAAAVISENPGNKNLYMDSHTTMLAELTYDSKLDPKLDAHFQAAVMYTTAEGARRVRVFNLLTGVATNMKSLLKFVDIDVVLAVITRQTLARLGEHESSVLRDAVLKKVMDIFGAARLYAGQGMPKTQLLMPVNLRELMMMGLALTKTVALGGRGHTVDTRVANAVWMSCATADQLSLTLYPRIHDVAEYSAAHLEAQSNEKREEVVEVPLGRGVRARYHDLLLGSLAHLILDGQQLYIWLGSATNAELIEQLFGVSTLSEVSPWLDELPELENEVSIAARKLCTLLAQRVGMNWLQLQIVRQELDGAEYYVRQLMVEDLAGDSPAHMTFVTKVHEHSNSYKENQSWF